MSDWVDEGSAVDEVYRDFQKAFEKVPQTMLLVKVRACGAAIWLSHLMIGGKKKKEKKRESGYYITGRM